MTVAHTISTNHHRCFLCWSAIRAGDLHRAFISEPPDEEDEDDYNPNEPNAVDRAHLGCVALWDELPPNEGDEPYDSIREALDYHYGLRSPDFVPTLRRLLAQATKTHQHPDPEFARVITRATWNDLRRVEARYFPKPPPRNRANVAEVREAAYAELMATVEAWCALDQIMSALFVEPPFVDMSLEEAMAADTARDEAAIHARIAAIRHTNDLLAQHGLPPEHRYERRRDMLTSLLGKIQPKEPTP